MKKLFKLPASFFNSPQVLIVPDVNEEIENLERENEDNERWLNQQEENYLNELENE